MNANTRACLAYIAGALVNGKGGRAVYDHTRSKHIEIGGSVTPFRINICDFERGCNLTGTLSNFYDSGSNSHISLCVTGNSFRGHDTTCGESFTGRVNGNSVSIYDDDDWTCFSYWL